MGTQVGADGRSTWLGRLSPSRPRPSTPNSTPLRASKRTHSRTQLCPAGGAPNAAAADRARRACGWGIHTEIWTDGPESVGVVAEIKVANRNKRRRRGGGAQCSVGAGGRARGGGHDGDVRHTRGVWGALPPHAHPARTLHARTGRQTGAPRRRQAGATDDGRVLLLGDTDRATGQRTPRAPARVAPRGLTIVWPECSRAVQRHFSRQQHASALAAARERPHARLLPWQRRAGRRLTAWPQSGSNGWQRGGDEELSEAREVGWWASTPKASKMESVGGWRWGTRGIAPTRRGWQQPGRLKWLPAVAPEGRGDSWNGRRTCGKLGRTPTRRAPWCVGDTAPLGCRWQARKRRRAQSHHQTARRGPQPRRGHPCLDAGPPSRRPRSQHAWPAAAAAPARTKALDTAADQERHRGPCWVALRRVIGSQAGSGKGEALDGDAERGGPEERRLRHAAPPAQWCLSCVFTRKRVFLVKSSVTILRTGLHVAVNGDFAHNNLRSGTAFPPFCLLYTIRRVSQRSARPIAFPQTGPCFLALDKKLRHTLLAEGV